MKRRALFVTLLVSVSLILTSSVSVLLHTELLHSNGNNGSAKTHLKNELSLPNIRTIAEIIERSSSSDAILTLSMNATYRVDGQRLRISGSAAAINLKKTHTGWTSEYSNLTSTRTAFSAVGESISKQLLFNEPLDEDSEHLSGDTLIAECAMGNERLGLWNVLDAVIYSALPACLLVFLDTLIVIRLHRAASAQHQHQQQCRLLMSRGASRNQIRQMAPESLLIESESFRNKLTPVELILPYGKKGNLFNFQSAVVRSVARQSIDIKPTSSAGAAPHPRARALQSTSGRTTHNDLRLTLVLLVPSVTFLALTLPIAAGHAIQMIIGESRLFKLVEPKVLMLLFAIAELFACTQHALNFYLCAIMSSSFRRATWRWMNWSTPFYWLLNGAHRVRALFHNLCCCFKHRSRNSLPEIRFRWVPAHLQVHIRPHIRNSAACIENDPLPTRPSLNPSHLPIPSYADNEFRYLSNPVEQIFSPHTLSFNSSFTRPTNGGVVAAGAAGSTFQVRHSATSPIFDPQADLLCVCIYRHSMTRSALHNAHNDNSWALNSSSQSWYKMTPFPIGGFNASWTRRKVPHCIGKYSNCERVATI